MFLVINIYISQRNDRLKILEPLTILSKKIMQMFTEYVYAKDILNLEAIKKKNILIA